MNHIQTEISYERMPYPALTYVHAHPDRMATIATLLGLNPVPVDCCRVLELGCAGGGNLIPAAFGLPESRFVGIDLSSGHIEEGKRAAAALGLSNVVLKRMSITELDPEFGQFDYIIVHGVFSWVPREIQEKILQVCRENLSPRGVAFVSYNTYPGWHLKNLVRDSILYHTRGCSGDPGEVASRARAFLELMLESSSAENTTSPGLYTAYEGVLKATLEDLRSKDDPFLLHDELADINTPLHFHEFAERAARQGLQYLFEADFPKHLYDRLPEEAKRSLEEASGDIIEMEQYIDFLTNRCFRRTLLCHEDSPVDRTLRPERVGGLFITSRARPLAIPSETEGDRFEEFRSPDGASIRSDGPFTRAAMRYLGEQWPRPVAFRDLFSAACSRAGVRIQSERDLSAYASSLGRTLLQGYSYSTELVNFHVRIPSFTPEVGDRPISSPVARFQAMSGSEVTNLRHERVDLGPFGRSLLLLLDGTRERADLRDEMIRFHEGSPSGGSGVVEHAKEERGDRDGTARRLDRHLKRFAGEALLVE